MLTWLINPTHNCNCSGSIGLCTVANLTTICCSSVRWRRWVPVSRGGFEALAVGMVEWRAKFRTCESWWSLWPLMAIKAAVAVPGRWRPWWTYASCGKRSPVWVQAWATSTCRSSTSMQRFPFWTKRFSMLDWGCRCRPCRWMSCTTSSSSTSSWCSSGRAWVGSNWRSLHTSLTVWRCSFAPPPRWSHGLVSLHYGFLNMFEQGEEPRLRLSGEWVKQVCKLWRNRMLDRRPLDQTSIKPQ